MKVVIKEVLRIRTNTGGIPRYLCLADGGQQFWVKGSGYGRRALCAEWMSYLIGKAAGMPLPLCTLVHVPRNVPGNAFISGRELGEGVWFGSFAIPEVREIVFDDLRWVDPETKKNVLLFDWCIRNMDRILGPRGGNPNVLCSPNSQQLFLIDHGLAFDLEFSASVFFSSHPFGDVRLAVDAAWLSWRANEFLAVSRQVSAFYKTIPESWRTDEDLLSTSHLWLEESAIVETIQRAVDTCIRSWLLLKNDAKTKNEPASES